jgi:ribonuclease HI
MVMNRIGWLAPASFTDAQLPGNKIPEAEKKDYASRIRSFGASGKRSKEQQAAARAEAKQMQDKLPESAIEVWTDGSRIGKTAPGPSGAGAIIKKRGAILAELTYYLGESTNQAAELWAIGGALETLQETGTKGEEIHIFTDSQFSIDCLTGKYFSAEHYHRISKTKKLARNINSTVFYHHVAGHAGIKDNDHADKLANAGSFYSQQHATGIGLNLDNILEHYTFNYLRLDGIT